MFVYVFAVTTSDTPKNDQTNSNRYTHPLLELYVKLHAGNSNITKAGQKQTSQLFLNSVEHQGWNGDEFNSYHKIDHVYQSGRRTETHHSYRSDIEAGWDVVSRDLYEYENDRLLTIVSQIKNGQGFQNEYRVSFTYQFIDNQYYLSETMDQFWNASLSDWINDERVVLVESGGKINYGESSSWVGDDWYTYELFFFEEQDDDLHITYQEPYGHMWMNTERQVYKNYNTKDLNNLFLNEFNVVESGSFLEFAEMMPDYTGQYWTGDDWLDAERQITVVDYNWQTGEMISKQISGQFFDEGWITTTEVRISYEDGMKSEMVLYLVEDYESGDPSPNYAELFEYNELGLVHFIVQKQAPEEVEKIANQEELEIFGRLMLVWGETTTSIGKEFIPVVFSLGNAYPNPFNPSTVIPFDAQTAGEISIRVYDMLGRHVATLASGLYPAGSHSIRFDATGLSSGVYLVRMTAPGIQQVRRVTLLK